MKSFTEKMNELGLPIAMGISCKTMLGTKNEPQDNCHKYRLYEVLKYAKHAYLLFTGTHICRECRNAHMGVSGNDSLVMIISGKW